MVLIAQLLREGVRDQFGIPQNVDGRQRTALVLEKALEALGSLLGMGGAFWFALRISGYSFAYVPFAVSSVLLTRHFYRKRLGWVMLQQAAYTAINLTGIYCWLMK